MEAFWLCDVSAARHQNWAITERRTMWLDMSTVVPGLTKELVVMSPIVPPKPAPPTAIVADL